MFCLRIYLSKESSVAQNFDAIGLFLLVIILTACRRNI